MSGRRSSLSSGIVFIELIIIVIEAIFVSLSSNGAGGDAVLHVDHKLPFSKGGTDEDDNLWTLCEACNLGKSNNYDDSDK